MSTSSRKHGELGEARALAPLSGSMLSSMVLATAGWRAAESRASKGQPRDIERLVDIGERRGKTLAALHPIAQRRIRQLEQQRPFAEPRRQVAQAAVEAVGQPMRDERQRLVLAHRVGVDAAGADRHRVEHAAITRAQRDPPWTKGRGGRRPVVDDHQDVAIDRQVDQRGGRRFDAGKPRRRPESR